MVNAPCLVSVPPLQILRKVHVSNLLNLIKSIVDCRINGLLIEVGTMLIQKMLPLICGFSHERIGFGKEENIVFINMLIPDAHVREI